jgi:hypothetical protein
LGQLLDKDQRCSKQFTPLLEIEYKLQPDPIQPLRRHQLAVEIAGLRNDKSEARSFQARHVH